MRILLATDGSEMAEAAMREVAARPWPAGSTVRVLSVVKDVYPIIPEAALSPSYANLTADLVRQAEQLVARTASQLASAGLAVETAVREGDPSGEIVDDAEKWHADLVVTGTHGRTGVKRLVMGSVAEYVVRHAPCSVEVARAGATH